MEAIIANELRRLARVDLKDYFIFEVGQAQKDLDGAPYGGARYSVSSLIDRCSFVRFQIDVGADIIVDEIRELKGADWLEYCGIETPKMRMISVEQQLVEKQHAYTLPRGERLNSRAKDLIDMLLLVQHRNINADVFKRTIRKVFKARDTHLLSEFLNEPPKEWAALYQTLADECCIAQTMSETFSELNQALRGLL